MSFRRYLYAVVGPAKDLLRDEDFVKNIFKVRGKRLGLGNLYYFNQYNWLDKLVF